MESEKATVMVLRDVTSRFRHVELEKEYLAEKIAREKDLESSRFMRHETKNHLLNVRMIVQEMEERLNIMEEVEDEEKRNLSHTLTKLKLENDKALGTVMKYSVIKEITHDEYEPSLKPMNLSSLFDQFSNPSVRIDPCTDQIPNIITDEFLVEIIMQNAISNALKYGRSDGKVTMKAFYNDAEKELKLIISNLPGQNSNLMRELPDPKVIFQRKKYALCRSTVGQSQIKKSNGISNYDNGTLGGIRLHKISNGDGGWIMKKCADLLKGKCSYRFEETFTEFSLSIPVKLVSSVFENHEGTSKDDLIKRLAENIVVVSLEDSTIQKLMMKRLFTQMGITCFDTGATAQEAIEFPTFVGNVSKLNPNKKLVILLDENLDYKVEGNFQSISGSKVIQDIKDSCKQNHSDVLILMRTANVSMSERASFKDRGAHGIFEKLIRTSDAVILAFTRHGLLN
uniref:Uncharacterized protein n=1 Tax=Aplanochytrium stocchinoi TaxID=215587 RepID=A0A7S3PJN7_9STRA